MLSSGGFEGFFVLEMNLERLVVGFQKAFTGESSVIFGRARTQVTMVAHTLIGFQICSYFVPSYRFVSVVILLINEPDGNSVGVFILCWGGDKLTSFYEMNSSAGDDLFLLGS